MTIIAKITRNRRPRAESTWEFNIAGDAIVVAGAVKANGDDMEFERAGWQAQQIVQTLVREMGGNPSSIKFEGLPPHPAALPSNSHAGAATLD